MGYCFQQLSDDKVPRPSVTQGDSDGDGDEDSDGDDDVGEDDDDDGDMQCQPQGDQASVQEVVTHSPGCHRRPLKQIVLI